MKKLLLLVALASGLYAQGMSVFPPVGGGGSATNFASQAECEAGVVDDEVTSPECVLQAILEFAAPASDPTKSGGVYMPGLTSGGTAVAVANIAGTAQTLILPTNNSAATSAYVLAIGDVTTCPTLPASFPSTCRSTSWAPPGPRLKAYWLPAPLTASATTGIDQANRVYYAKVSLPGWWSGNRVGVYWQVGAGTVGIGFMDANCDLIPNSTATAVAPGAAAVLFTLAGTITIPSGAVYIGWTSTNTSDAPYGHSASSESAVANANASDLTFFRGANDSIAGVLPSSCGAKTAVTQPDSPAFFLQ